MPAPSTACPLTSQRATTSVLAVSSETLLRFDPPRPPQATIATFSLLFRFCPRRIAGAASAAPAADRSEALNRRRVIRGALRAVMKPALLRSPTRAGRGGFCGAVAPREVAV